jgi:hypothetical protein
LGEITLFVSPSFTLWNIIYTAIGVAVFWGTWGRSRLQAYVLSDLVTLLGLGPRARAVTEFVIFLVVGCLVGIGVTNPSNPTQALTAGFGWTGFFAKRR